uniref:Uncharacterized protein n=1 Tax=Caenorhabditis tropicalis TaxID=1561998 RepID=A0A1I7UDC5_9PELO
MAGIREFSTSSSSSSSSSQQYCVQKERIELIVVIVVLLILLQIGLALFFYKRCVARTVMDSSSVYSEGSSRTTSSSSSSAYNTCSRQMTEVPPVLPILFNICSFQEKRRKWHKKQNYYFLLANSFQKYSFLRNTCIISTLNSLEIKDD